MHFIKLVHSHSPLSPLHSFSCVHMHVGPVLPAPPTRSSNLQELDKKIS